MRFYYFHNNNLYNLFSFKKIQIDYNFTERFRITKDLLTVLTNDNKFKIDNPKLKALVLTFLYKYIYENVTGLYIILKSRKELDKSTFVIRKGNAKIFKIKEINDLNIISNHGLFYLVIMFLGYYRLGLKKNISQKYQHVIVLIKNDILSTRIWNLLTRKINLKNSIVDDNYFGFLLKDYFMPLPEIINALNELRIYKKILGYSFYIKTKFYLISGFKFLRMNPSKYFITFEQNTISYMVLSYVAEKMNVVSVSISHAVINGNYKRHMAFDYCLLYGKSSEESYQRKDSVISGKIFKTGAPIMESLFSNIHVPSEWKNKVLFLTDYITEFGYDIKNVHLEKNSLIKKLITEYPEITLTVKYHPAKINPYSQSILSDCKNVIFKQNVSIHDEIDNTDLVICDGWSSSGLETAIRKRPLFVLNVKQEREDLYKYYESGYAYNIYNEETLFCSFESVKSSVGIINEKARNELINYHLEYLDSIAATSRTLETILAA
ncbi:hypothetical protein BH10BAC5_BH10BAC5_14290 [soil metagenome]